MRRPILVTGAVLALSAVVLTGCSSSKKSSTPRLKAIPAAVTATCSLADGYIECTLPSDATQISVSGLLASAAAVDSDITGSRPMVITAFGGTGGGLKNKGDPGEAETLTTEAAYEKSFGDSLYYFLGKSGYISENNGATGASSTIVSTVNLARTAPCADGYGGCAAANLLALAGGGGGEGAGAGCGAGDGGQGGIAIQGSTKGSGSPGGDGGCSGGHGGKGGGAGNAGAGGLGGAGVDPHAGKYGQAGVGGMGGPVHTSSGPGDATEWTAVGPLSPIADAGEGGEGEWRGDSNPGGGGGGGGGFGGGGGGGSGGAAEAGGGGGGGGSYAAAATETAPYPTVTGPTTSGAAGEVVVVFEP